MKRVTVIILVLGVIGIGFYIGYRMAVSPKPEQVSSEDIRKNLAVSPEFEKIYSLLPNEDIKYIGPPFLPSRDVFYRNLYKRMSPVIEKVNKFSKQSYTMIFIWDGKLAPKITTRGGSMPIVDLLFHIVQVSSSQIEGDYELLRGTPIPGDFIIREGLESAKKVELLEAIFQRQLHLPVKIAFKEVPRKVIIVCGNYQYIPLPGVKPSRQAKQGIDKIIIYGNNRDTVHFPMTPGSFDNFLSGLADIIFKPIINETQNPPKTIIECEVFTDSFRDQAQINLMFQHLTEQTGLTFTEETRPMQILFVERTDFPKLSRKNINID
jgi:hypothetical protein